MACGSWVLALAVARGWTAPFSPSVDVLLAPAAVAVACGVGLGISAFEIDLSGYQFGWRQLAAADLGGRGRGRPAPGGRRGRRRSLGPAGHRLRPAAVVPGRHRLDPTASTAATEVEHQLERRVERASAYRVLWLGDPRALPTGGWSIIPGLAYATSEQGTPDATNLWSPASPGPATDLAAAVQLAAGWPHRGARRAPGAVGRPLRRRRRRGGPDDQRHPAAAGVRAASPGWSVPCSTRTISSRCRPAARATRSSRTPRTCRRGRSGRWPRPARPRRGPAPDQLSGWRPVLPGPAASTSYAGPVAGGTVFSSYAPGRRVEADGRRPPGAGVDCVRMGGPVPVHPGRAGRAPVRRLPARPARRGPGVALVGGDRGGAPRPPTLARLVVGTAPPPPRGGGGDS